MGIVGIGLAFIEGLVLIASPCILPVLPLILGASVDGGKKRPFGIIFGFVLSFTLFALLSRAIVNSLGIDLNIIKYVSLIFLGLLGLIMLFEPLAKIFSKLTMNLANKGNNLSNKSGEGFIGGILIGGMIGLVWTPCAGPVIAVVLVQIIREQSNIQALFLITSFAFGAGVPMLIIALTGRGIMNRVKFLMIHAQAIRKIFAIMILGAVFFIASGLNAQSLFAGDQTSTNSSSNLEAGIDPYQAPELTGINAWLNSSPLTLASLKGKVILIDFWTYSCINCIRTLPYVTKWDRDYRDKGLVVIGVHAPEFEFEKNIDNIKSALVRFNIKYPVALDNNLDTWTAFNNQYWPAHYLINQDGKVVYTHFGEGNYDETENNIRNLLGISKKTDSTQEISLINDNQTPETYLGFSRAESFSSPENISNSSSFTLPKFTPNNHWALSGDWSIENEKIIAQQQGAELQLNFIAGKVFLVLGSATGQEIKINISLNGNPIAKDSGKDVVNGVLTVKEHRLYELVSQSAIQNGLLSIKSQSAGLEAYAFTFGK